MFFSRGALWCRLVIFGGEVLTVISSDGGLHKADGEPGVGYVCLFRPGQAVAEVGQRGTLTFTRGGPTGGYWKYHPDPQAPKER